MDFINLMKAENDQRKTLTENGAVAYATTGKELLDFNFKLSSMRKMTTEEIKSEYAKVYFEDPLVAIKYAFWVGDIRGGAGERKAFRACLVWLAENKPEIMERLIPLVGEYNRFDSLVPLLDTKLRSAVISYYKWQIEKDVENMNANKNVSLLAKWICSENTSSAETKRCARIIREGFGWTPVKYRKTLSALRKYLNIVERKMAAREWTEINYETVPSKANLIYSEAFLRNDEERRRAYLESLKKGEAKINAGVLQPHEIVTKYRANSSWWGYHVDDYNETLEQLWRNLPNETILNTLIVRDGSGSMTDNISGNTTCLDVATALTIYMAERNRGEWKDKFITFSSRPEVIDISNCFTLHDKLELISHHNDCSNTDIYKTMKLILDTALINKVPQEEMPKTIVICSDMQFDGRAFRLDKTLFEEITDEFNENGYNMPRLVFWNINDRGECSVPLKQNEMGLILCSGFSTNIMKMFMSGELDPYKVLLEQINSNRYAPIERAISGLV